MLRMLLLILLPLSFLAWLPGCGQKATSTDRDKGSPVSAVPNSPPTLDPAALTLLQKAQSRLKSIKTFHGRVVQITSNPPDDQHTAAWTTGQFIDLRLLRPNIALLQEGDLEQAAPRGAWNEGKRNMTEASDGDKTVMYLASRGQYSESISDPAGKNIDFDIAEPL